MLTINLPIIQEELDKILDRYIKGGIINGEEILFIYHAILECKNPSYIEIFNNFANLINAEYERKQKIKLSVIRDQFYKEVN